MQRIRVWDGPTRLVHWLFVLAVLSSWWTAENRLMDYHRYSGYVLLGLLIFRIYWGIAGSRTSQFASFVKGPRAIIEYLRSARSEAHDVGHNPLGALSVVALLALLVTQVALGLFAVDVDGLESGPLSYLVSFETGRAVAKAHDVIFDCLIVLVCLHVAAIFFYLIVKRDNLLRPMVTGTKMLDRSDDAAVSLSIQPLSWMRFLIGVVIAAALVWLII